jgi:CRISPR-associated endonuclease/helicase Cas3
MTLLLPCSAGGYDPDLGFTGLTAAIVAVALEEKIVPDQDDSDNLSQGATEFVKLAVHAQDVAEEVETLCQQLAAFELPAELLIKAGRWHDAGKAHPLFQTMLTHNRPEQVGTTLWAKSDHDFKNLADRYAVPPDRRGFRHELVSALLALQEQQDFLLCYLVACHHGKVRMTIQPRPTEKTVG